MSEKIMVLFITINIDYTNLSDKSDENINNIIKELEKSDYQVSWFYLVEEIENFKHYHILLGVKCLIETNNNFKTNILNSLKNNISLDIVIKRITTFENIKQKFVYILKNSYSSENNNIDKHYAVIETHLKEKNQYFINFLEKFIFLKLINGFTINNISIGSVYNPKLLENTKESSLNLIKWYFLLNNIRYKNGFLYKKIENSINSYYQYDTITWIKNNFFNIFYCLLIKFPLNFEGENFDDFLIKNKITKEEIDLTLKNLPHNNNLIIRFDIIEFTNGFYFFNMNKFLEKTKFLQNLFVFNKNTILIKYYKKKYNRNNTPKNWKQSVLNVLNNNNEKFEIICAYLANTIIKNKDIFEKQKILYIWGNSSTGKTTIIAKPLWKYFGEENIGIITGSKNFGFEKLVDKELAILDEYKYTKKRRETDLKLFEGQTIIEDAKYKDQQKIKELNLIVLSNFSINPDDYETENEKKNTDIALTNRVKLIKFLSSEEIKNPINLTTKIIKNIEKEDPYTLIYCNKIYHKKYIKNTGKTKNELLIKKIVKENIIENTQTKTLK